MASEFNHGYAVLISIDSNQIAQLALPSVLKDVQALYDVLIHPERCAYKPENVKLLQGEASTQRNIFDALYWLQEKVKADPEATAVIYYTGHGMVDQETEQYYLVPYDIQGLNRIRADAIRAETLTAEISAIPAKRMLVILDCCHAAGMDIKDIDLSNGPKIEAKAFPLDLPETKAIPEYEAGSKDVSALAEGEGRAILNSSTGEQKSYVRRDGAMSLFTYHLIEALTGHAPHPDDATVVYVTDVMSWVTHEVKKSAAREGVVQTPVMRTTGVFPVAQLLGGKGVATAKGEIPPDPLQPLPPTSRGDQVGRDKITVGNITGSQGVAIGSGASAAVHTGDTITMSGNFSGSNVNVKSTLTNVTQTIGTLPDTSQGDKQKLEQLVQQLHALLQQAPPTQAATADEVAEATEILINTAAAETANKTMIKMLGDGLKQAAQRLKDDLPQIVDITANIVTIVSAVAGLAK